MRCISRCKNNTRVPFLTTKQVINQAPNFFGVGLAIAKFLIIKFKLNFISENVILTPVGYIRIPTFFSFFFTPLGVQ